MEWLAEAGLDLVYRQRINPLLELIDAYAGEVETFRNMIANWLAGHRATGRFRVSAGSGRPSPRSSSPRSARPAGSPAWTSCVAGLGSHRATASSAPRCTAGRSPSRFNVGALGSHRRCQRTRCRRQLKTEQGVAVASSDQRHGGGVEDWAEIRRWHRAEQMSISQIARVQGVSKNTVRSALSSDAPPKYERTPAGSIVDAVEPRIRELLRAYPTPAARVTRQARSRSAICGSRRSGCRSGSARSASRLSCRC